MSKHTEAFDPESHASAAPPHVSTPPTRLALERSMDSLEAETTKLAGLVVQLGRRLGPALQVVEPDARHAIIDADDEIDDLDSRITQHVVEAIIRFQPVASDLRRLLAYHDTTLHLERIADGIVEVVTIAGGDLAVIGPRPVELITQMVELALGMTSDAVTALTNRDADMARRVEPANVELAGLSDVLLDELATSLGTLQDHRSAQELRRVIEASRVGGVVQRCGEHALDIAEQALFLITGEMKELGRDSAPVAD